MRGGDLDGPGGRRTRHEVDDLPGVRTARELPPRHVLRGGEGRVLERAVLPADKVDAQVLLTRAHGGGDAVGWHDGSRGGQREARRARRVLLGDAAGSGPSVAAAVSSLMGASSAASAIARVL